MGRAHCSEHIDLHSYSTHDGYGMRFDVHRTSLSMLRPPSLQGCRRMQIQARWARNSSVAATYHHGICMPTKLYTSMHTHHTQQQGCQPHAAGCYSKACSQHARVVAMSASYSKEPRVDSTKSVLVDLSSSDESSPEDNAEFRSTPKQAGDTHRRRLFVHLNEPSASGENQAMAGTPHSDSQAHRTADSRSTSQAGCSTAAAADSSSEHQSISSAESKQSKRAKRLVKVAAAQKWVKLVSKPPPGPSRHGLRKHFTTRACQPGCTGDGQGTAHQGWCSFPVTTPFGCLYSLLNMGPEDMRQSRDAPGQPRLIALPGMYQAMLVQDVAALKEGVDWLRASVLPPGADGLLSIDLEWKPEYKRGQSNKLALVQVASASRCLLVHLALMRNCTPGQLSPLVQLLQDDSLTGLVTAGWNRSEQVKVQEALGITTQDLPRLLDLQSAAKAAGCSRVGLQNLVGWLLGLPEWSKSKSTSMSNWEAALSPQMTKYAILDGFLPGILFRQLRFLHASPHRCAWCQQELYAPSLPTTIACEYPGCCSNTIPDVESYQRHIARLQHSPAFHWSSEWCEHCGRGFFKKGGIVALPIKRWTDQPQPPNSYEDSDGGILWTATSEYEACFETETSYETDADTESSV